MVGGHVHQAAPAEIQGADAAVRIAEQHGHAGGADALPEIFSTPAEMFTIPVAPVLPAMRDVFLAVSHFGNVVQRAARHVQRAAAGESTDRKCVRIDDGAVLDVDLPLPLRPAYSPMPLPSTSSVAESMRVKAPLPPYSDIEPSSSSF